ncbi:2Fe-2S iron-sulfur cluster-binding protein [Sulfobacillus sp. hq2]|uniref:2Fe-2S iron-sulfur cluster-binding protein n=1 Tax=Sulfobacillus TaxID=28033 RepID=UPI001FA8D40E|nr:2Fe-2S iron-sulfur cluster-binding protein [Sulfobacillus sp. hq2]
MMEKSISLTIDGQVVTVAPGTTLRAACEQAQHPVPTLCWHENLTPANACRACVVELKGSRTLVASCSRVAEDGMEVLTASERVQNARQVVAELLLSTSDATLAPSLQELAQISGADPNRFAGGATWAQPMRDDNNLYVRDLSKCILCYRCVEACGDDAQNTFAIAVAGRGFDAHIDAGFGRELPESDCVFCGNCVAVCPTGALIGKKEYELRQEGQWDESQITTTETVCSYCGVGCDLQLHVLDNQIVKVTSPADHPVTHGMLCVKGRYGYAFAQSEDE